jgi:S-adenosylmethionine:tRNA ribosyltransferase-isomerase
MRLEDFDYHLPERCIAQHPCEKRDNARMMIVDRATGNIGHAGFLSFPEYCKKGDVLVVNDSKVIPAKLIGKRETGGLIEILLLSKISLANANASVWEAMLKPSRRIRTGDRLFFESNGEAVIDKRLSDKKWQITFILQTTFDDFLHRHGRAPLPPYIKRKKETAGENDDRERYQTVYAKIPGSVAAPTAGLHFSHDVLGLIREKGASIAPVTLHVGHGTFAPIDTEQVEDHRMHEEYFEIGKSTADSINSAKRVIAVGTTSTRVIEAVADNAGRVKSVSSHTDIFLYPGYHFKRVNSMLTNFHLPKSSLFLLVCSFAGRDLMQEAYRQAVREGYRFYSYGDCMLIL